jgi:hypothetical protein
MAKRSDTQKLISTYLKKLGSKGGKARAAKYDAGTLSTWARKGGRPRTKGNK